MRNSIEDTKKQLELMLKVRKEQKDIIECAGGSCMNCDPDIKALSKSIEILSEYKKALKENEQLKKENEKLNHKIKGQECVIETQSHTEEVYERIFERLEKENKELKNALNVEQK